MYCKMSSSDEKDCCSSEGWGFGSPEASWVRFGIISRPAASRRANRRECPVPRSMVVPLPFHPTAGSTINSFWPERKVVKPRRTSGATRGSFGSQVAHLKNMADHRERSQHFADPEM